METQPNLVQWLRDPITDKLVSFFADRKEVLEEMITSGLQDHSQYKEYCGERRGLVWLEIFIATERENSKHAR